MSENTNSGGMSNSTKTIITVILLFVFPLAGIIMMFVWKLWPVWVRVLITVFYALALIGTIISIVSVGLFVSNEVSNSSSSSSKSGVKPKPVLKSSGEEKASFKLNDKIEGNGYDFEVTAFTKETITSGNSTKPYCAVSFKVKNTTSENVTLYSSDLTLTDTTTNEVKYAIQPVSEPSQFYNFTKPTGLDKISTLSLPSQTEARKFAGFDCDPAKGPFELKFTGGQLSSYKWADKFTPILVSLSF